MSLRYFMDVHVPQAVSVGLRLNGAFLLDDAALLKRSTELQRVLFTQDSDFLREAARNQTKGTSFSGVIFAHQLKISIGQCVEELWLIFSLLDEADMNNQIMFLPL